MQLPKFPLTLIRFLQIGSKTGPRVDANASALEIHQPDGVTLEITRGADPVGPHDYATKEYVDATAGGGFGTRVPFAFSTTSPLVLQAVPAGAMGVRASVIIDTTFNGIGANIQLGTTTTPSKVFAPPDVTLTVVGNTYDNNALVEFTTPDFLILTITPAGSTQGAGVLYYQLLP